MQICVGVRVKGRRGEKGNEVRTNAWVYVCA